MCLLKAAVLVRHVQIVALRLHACGREDMPSLIRLLAGLPLKNKKWISLPCVKSFWPVQLNVAAGLERKRVMKPLHPDQLPVGLIGGEKALSQEPSGGTRSLEQPPCVFLGHTRVRF